MTEATPPCYSGVYHVNGPCGQIRQMAEWADREGNRTYPDRETLRKIATNLWAAADALEGRDKKP